MKSTVLIIIIYVHYRKHRQRQFQTCTPTPLYNDKHSLTVRGEVKRYTWIPVDINKYSLLVKKVTKHLLLSPETVADK